MNRLCDLKECTHCCGVGFLTCGLVYKYFLLQLGSQRTANLASGIKYNYQLL